MLTLDKTSDPTKTNYFCAKVIVTSKTHRILSLSLMYFQVVLRSKDLYEVIFYGRPFIVIKTYYKDVGIDVFDTWKTFETKMFDYKKETYNRHLSTYSRIYRGVYHNYYHNLYGNKYQDKERSYKLEKSFRLLANFKEDLNDYLSSLWSFHEINIELDFENISDEEFNVKIKNKAVDTKSKSNDIIKKNDQSDKNNKKASIDWFFGSNVIVKNYSPVISVNDGKMCRDLNIGDHIIVTKNESGDVNNPLPSGNKITYSALLIDKAVDSNNCQRFLVKLDKEYGDIEVYDDLTIIKTVNGINENSSEKVSSSQSLFTSSINLNFLLGLLLVIGLIFIVYSLFSSLI